MPDPIFIIDIGPDGAVAVHPRRLQLPVLVAPIPDEQKAVKFNAVRQELLTIGCMRLPHIAFEFDSSFLGPDSAARFTKFAGFMQALRDQDDADPKRFPPISVFGHADPTGGDAYNKPLSGRRALAVYGLLTRKLKIWTDLSKGLAGDQWGDRVHRRMLSISLRKLPDGTPEPPFYTGLIDSDDPAEKAEITSETHAALAAYKEARGTPPPASGDFDSATRDKLFTEYMDAICQDKTGAPFVLTAETDFLARNIGADHKGDVQGCSDFNPIFLLAKAENDIFNASESLHETRNELYAKDRRVVVFVFKHGLQVDPNRWPCPTASNPDNSPCIKRFWSDANDRKKLGEERRVFGKNMDLAQVDDDGNVLTDDAGNVAFHPLEETGNTMRCRFYHGFAVHSPCEAGLKEWIVRFRIDGFEPKPGTASKPVPLANRRFVLTMGEVEDSAIIRGALDGDGQIRIPVLDEHVVMTLKLDAFGVLFDLKDDGSKQDDGLVDGKFPDEDKFMALKLDAGQLKKMRSDQDVDDIASKQRLYNLGFGPSNPATWDRQKDLVPAAAAYRRSRGLPKDADLRDALVNEHELQGAPPPLDPDDDPTQNQPPAP